MYIENMIVISLILLIIQTIALAKEHTTKMIKYSQLYYASVNDIPYHVLIVYDNLYCSGGLILSRMVLTAASCFKKLKRNTVIVKVGAQTTTDFGQVIEVIEVKKHEYYGRYSEIDNDIAILMLKDHVAFRTYVKKVIVTEKVSIDVGDNLNVTGWGSANLQAKYMNKLLCSEMALVSETECKDYFLTFKTSANFCVRYQKNQMLSDNGGPVVYHDKLVGIVSYGADKNREPYLALVTNVSYFYKWIDLNVGRLLNKYCAPPLYYEYYYYTDSIEYHDLKKTIN